MDVVCELARWACTTERAVAAHQLVGVVSALAECWGLPPETGLVQLAVWQAACMAFHLLFAPMRSVWSLGGCSQSGDAGLHPAHAHTAGWPAMADHRPHR